MIESGKPFFISKIRPKSLLINTGIETHKIVKNTALKLWKRV